MLDGIIYAKVAHNTEFEKSRRGIMKAWTNHFNVFLFMKGQSWKMCDSAVCWM